MCGICGFSLGSSERVDAATIAGMLLVGIEERGRHATGAAWDNGDGQVWVSKAPMPASKFVGTIEKSIPADTRTFIGHTRWATQGSPENNDNNHPIDVNGIVGIHNGCIYNDDTLFERIGKEKRIAEVDSEAIFAYILHSNLPITQALAEVKGSAAVAWMDTEDPDTIHLARISSSPLIVAMTEAGSLFFASTRACLNEVADWMKIEYSSITEIPEGTYFTVRHGEILSMKTFTTEKDRVLSDTERKALNVA